MAAIHAFGDSITMGVEGSPGYADRLAAELGMALSNYAGSGHQAGDQAFASMTFIASPDDIHVVMAGFNDVHVYEGDTAKQAYTKASLLRLLLNILCPERKTLRSGNVTLTGNWTNTGVNSIGKWSCTAGDTAEATVEGTAIYVGYLYHNHASSQSSIEIIVDGVSKGVYSTDGANCTTFRGLLYPAGALRIGGLSAGSHAVTVRVNTQGENTYIDFIAGSAGTDRPSVVLGQIVRMAAAGYAALGGSEALCLVYNGFIDDIVASLRSDGHVIRRAMSWSAVHPSTDVASDGKHPSQSGHDKLFLAFHAAIMAAQVAALAA